MEQIADEARAGLIDDHHATRRTGRLRSHDADDLGPLVLTGSGGRPTQSRRAEFTTQKPANIVGRRRGGAIGQR